jgi:SAM-dependent methyltransferase
MKPTERFTDRVENYIRYRPNYPAQVLELLRDEMNLNENSTVADIGSGTGIFTRQLLQTGCRVFGVEPNEAMRRAADEFLRGFPNFKNIEGAAEATNLPDASVDFVAAAQAFHWFDAEKTRAEFRRILRPRGFVVLIWNERQLASTAFLRDYEQLLLEFGTDYAEVRHDKISETILRDFFQIDFQMRSFQNVQTVDFDGLKGRLLSASYAPNAAHPRFTEMLLELERLFKSHQTAGKVEIIYDTRVFYGKF